jgi:hypothetical protein
MRSVIDELGGGKAEKGKEDGRGTLVDFRLSLYRQLPRYIAFDPGQK